ncbi:ERMES complex subunit mmm1 [Agyrium rufum]|nr:ERMES complex subunit mmm1 [Agyrium rufum]
MSTTQNPPPQSVPQPAPQLSLSFTQGFLLGQLSIVLLLAAFLKYFIFGEPTSPHSSSQSPSTSPQQQQYSSPLSPSLRPKHSHSLLRRHHTHPSISTLLSKTFYNVSSHPPESLDWFNVLVAQTIAQFRLDALADNAILNSLNDLLNGERKPDFLERIEVTDISLGEEYPIFSNCRVERVVHGQENDVSSINHKHGNGPAMGAQPESGGRLQARMDVDVNDAMRLGLETVMVLNYPRPRIAVLPVALEVSVVRFSGTLVVSFLPSGTAPAHVVPLETNSGAPSARQASSPRLESTRAKSPPTPGPQAREFQTLAGIEFPGDDQDSPNPKPARSPTTLSLSFLPNYTLHLSTRSLLGSRSRLQDVPKIAQLVEYRLRAWFEERYVWPRGQRVPVPSLWPRLKNTVGMEGGADAEEGESGTEVEEQTGKGAVRSGVKAGMTDAGAEAGSRSPYGAARLDQGGLRRRGFPGEDINIAGRGRDSSRGPPGGNLEMPGGY